MEGKKTNLSHLKDNRVFEILPPKNPSLLDRIKRKFPQKNRGIHKLIKGLAYIVYSALRKIKNRSLTFIKNFSFEKKLRKINRSSASVNILIAFRLTGGVGDFIVHRRVIRDFILTYPNIQFDIFTNSQQSAEFVFAEMKPKLRQIFPIHFFETVKQHYDVTLIMHQICYFSSINLEKINQHAPLLAICYKKNLRRLLPFHKCIETHPFLDNFLAELAVKEGLTRETLIHYLLDLSYGGCALDFHTTPENNIFQLKPHTYITVHNGWDVNLNIPAKQATKNYPDKHWGILVQLLKQQLPHISIVQVGAKTSRPIHGVTINLINKTTLNECATIIKNSALHIDSESGLVHLAMSLGIKSVVLFGPTNPQYFAYKENINLIPSNCINCWSLTNDWMAKCPRNLPVPECLESIHPATIASAVVQELLKN